jgi:PAS domain S-box-containing protein
VTRYGLAVACAAAAMLGAVAMPARFAIALPHVAGFLAVAASAWVAGRGPGILATVLCAVVTASVWLPGIRSPGELFGLAAFVVGGVVLSVLGAAVRSRQDQLAELLNQAADGVIAVDRDWRCTVVTARAVERLGRPTEAIRGRQLWDAFPECVGTPLEEQARRAMHEGVAAELDPQGPPGGPWRHVRVVPLRRGMAIVFPHVSSAHAVHIQRLAAIVQHADDAIVSKTLDGIITSWNPAAERMFGYTAEEAIGRSILLIIPPERHAEEGEILRRLRAGELVDHFQTVRVRKDGTPVDISLTVSPLKDDQGRIVGASKIARDVTQQKRLQAERDLWLARERITRAEAEAANREKDEFLAVLSHELRTPLNAVYGWARMLRSGRLAPGETERALDVIVRNTETQIQLINDLLEVSRIVAGKLRLEPRVVDLAAVVEAALDVVRPTAAAKEVRLEAVLDPNSGLVMGDPDRLQQVVWNLLTNAVKFTPRRGRVQVVLRPADSSIEMIVADTGIGIPPEILPIIFERFRQGDSSSTRAHTGLGLGLALVRHLVELHGGTVVAESEGEGRGATFTVRLPRTLARHVGRPAESGAGEPATLGGIPRLVNVRVLAVDDDPESLQVARAILAGAGAEVHTSASARDALEALQRDPPDVLVSDIEMPGEDGYALIQRVRALAPAAGGRTPALALTAYARRNDRRRALAAGYQMYVAKPVDPDELVTVVASLAGRLGSRPDQRSPA